MQIKFDYYPVQCTLESLNLDHAGILQRSGNLIHGVFNAIPGSTDALKIWLGQTYSNKKAESH